MKLAVSNIAWAPEENDQVLPMLSGLGVQGIEVAPGQVSHAYLAGELDRPAFEAWCRKIERCGLEPIALQGILAGLGEASLFGSASLADPIVSRVRLAGQVAAILGVETMVFGNPGLRRDRKVDRACDLRAAAPALARAAAAARTSGAFIAFEPNAAIYGCDFGRTLDECWRVAEHIGAPGLGIHFDLAAAVLGERSLEAAIRGFFAVVRYMHLSEPHLAPVGSGDLGAHRETARVLLEIHRSGRSLPSWLSIEMARPKGVSTAEALATLERSVVAVRALYRDILE